MVSPEIIKLYRKSAKLSEDNILALAKIGNEETFEPGTILIREGEPVETFYDIMQGQVSFFLEVPDREAGISVSEQLTGKMPTREIIIGSHVAGGSLGWAGIFPPNKALSSAKTVTECKMIAFDCQKLRELLESDRDLAYSLLLSSQQELREQFRSFELEVLSLLSES
jgi:CRP-like cAMP-binding protein